jgi:hypothetical protein
MTGAPVKDSQDDVDTPITSSTSRKKRNQSSIVVTNHKSETKTNRKAPSTTNYNPSGSSPSTSRVNPGASLQTNQDSAKEKEQRAQKG